MVKFAHQKQKYMNIELIIFDFDGTLGDTRRNIVLTMQSTMRQLGLDIADEETCTATIGIPLKAAFARIFPHLHRNLQKTIRCKQKITDPLSLPPSKRNIGPAQTTGNTHDHSIVTELRVAARAD